MINVSVLITTLNEAGNLPRCLTALKDFDEIILIDSGSTDGTQDIAKARRARVENFNWNGDYPKKRQWVLDNIHIKHDWIFFVDGDEEVTPELIDEIKNLNFSKAGYFVKGQYIWDGVLLQHGLQNNKLVLFDKNKVQFPEIDDLGAACMGEMEGHYQPVLKLNYGHELMGQLRHGLRHFAYEDKAQWERRHQRYSKWEADMIRRRAYPKDPSNGREYLKRAFRKMPCRGVIAFIHSYLLKFGFLDGRAGYGFAKSRYDYYQMVSHALKTNKT